MKYDESKDFSIEAWKDEDYHYLYIDGSQNKSEAKNFICNEYRPEVYIECILVSDLF